MYPHESDEPAPPESFEDVYSAYAPRVYRFCLSLLHDPARAEDVASDAFVSAYAAWDLSRPAPDRVLVWLFTIARNAAIDDIRKRARWRVLFERIGPEVAGGEQVDPAQRAELGADVRRAVDAMSTLRRRDRTLIALRLGGELSYAEMAPIVAMTEHAVAVATRRAVERLRRLLDETP